MAAGFLKAQLATEALRKGADLAAKAVARVVSAVPKLASELNQLAKSAKAAGVSIGDLQKTQGAFDLLTEGGVNAAETMQRLDKRIAEAAARGGEAAVPFQRIGVDLAALESAAPVERMAMLADGLGNVGSRAERSRILVQLFEESGRRLVPAFEAGGDAIREAAGQIEAAGLFSEEAAAGAEAFEDQVKLLRTQLDGFRRQVLAPLLPMFARVVEALRDLVAEGPPLDEWADDMEAAFLDIIAPAMAAAVVTALDLADALKVAWKGTQLLYGTGGMIERWDAFTEAMDTFGDASEAAAAKYERAMATIRSGGTQSGGRSRGGGGGGDDGGGTATGLGGDADPEEELLGTVALVQDVALTQQQVYDDLFAKEDRLAAMRQSNLQGWVGAANAAGSAVSSIAGAVADAAIDASNRESKTRKEAALKAFRINKASALVQAGISTALAVANAATTVPFIPSGIIAMAAAGIAGAVQIGVIAGKQPPTFHRGGVLQADEVSHMVRARAGEASAVLSPQGIANGGIDAVHSANAGRGGGGETVNVIKFGARVADVQTHRQLQRPSSPLSSAFRATQPRGLGRRNAWAKV